MNIPKIHHYLPQSYLQGFCSEGYAYVLNINKKHIKRLPTMRIAAIKHFYKFIDEAGKTTTSLEIPFFSKIDSSAIKIIRKLEKLGKINYSEKKSLALFIGLLMTRVPAYENQIKKDYDKLCKFILKQTYYSLENTKRIIQGNSEEESFDPKKTEEFYKFVQSENYRITPHHSQFLQIMVDNGIHLANYFLQMNWVICIKNGTTSFITTDNPVTLVPPENYRPGFWGVGITTKGAKKIIPLSSNICLLILDKGNKLRFKRVKDFIIQEMNHKIARNCEEYVYSIDEKSLAETFKI